MYYLVTGTNGAGKTLNALKWARELQLKDNRAVYYVGFDIVDKYKEEFGWQEFDPTKWMDLPDGAICIMDECQKYFPNRPVGSKVPDYVMALTEHRKRGFDFFMITQHPGNIDSFIRKLIGSPSWHRHLKRIAGQNLVNCIEWNYCHSSPEKPAAASDGNKKLIPYPKEVQNWYKSAEIHTVKKTIPKKVILFALCVIAVPLLFWYGFGKVSNLTMSPEEQTAKEAQSEQTYTRQYEPADINRPMTVQEYIESHKPRIKGFPATAPRYDEITKPVAVPRPAACIHFIERDECKCYTQRSTEIVSMDKQTCINIAKNGYFEDYITDDGYFGNDVSQDKKRGGTGG